MSQENVESFKRAFEAGSRRDAEALLEELDPEVEWHAVLPMVGGDAVYRGHEGVREFLREVWEVLAYARFEFPEIRDLGDQVLGIGHFYGRGRSSGVETEMPFAYLSEFKNGKTIRVRAFIDVQAALKAAGLSE